MHKLIVGLACMGSAGHGRRLQPSTQTVSDPWKDLATALVGFNPAAAFNPSVPTGVHRRSSIGSRGPMTRSSEARDRRGEVRMMRPVDEEATDPNAEVLWTQAGIDELKKAPGNLPWIDSLSAGDAFTKVHRAGLIKLGANVDIDDLIQAGSLIRQADAEAAPEAAPEAAAGASADIAEYRWSEGEKDVMLWVPLAEGFNKEDVAVKFDATKLSLKIGKDGDEKTQIVQGSLRGTVDPEECYWSLEDTGEDGIEVQVVLTKKNQGAKWGGVLKGDGDADAEPKGPRYLEILNEVEALIAKEAEVDPALFAEARSSMQAEVQNLKMYVASAEEKASQVQGVWEKQVVDFRNFKLRNEEDVKRTVANSKKKIMASLIPVLDTFTQANKAAKPKTEEEEKIVKGYEKVQAEMEKILEGQGLTKAPGVGAPFDSDIHEALMMQPTTDFPDQTVMMVSRDGYLFEGRSVRPGEVIVAENPAPPPPPPPAPAPAPESEGAEEGEKAGEAAGDAEESAEEPAGEAEAEAQ